MFSGSSESTQMAGAIDPCATSASRPPAASPSIAAMDQTFPSLAPTSQPMAPTPSPTPPAMAPTSHGALRVRTLAPLLLRDNVKAILGLAGVESVSIRVLFDDGRTDHKTISLAAGGSLALLLLDDNPDDIPAGAFCDIRPGQI